MMSDEETTVVEANPIAGIGTKVFGKWDASEITCRDPVSPLTSTSPPLVSPHRWSPRQCLVWEVQAFRG